MVHAKAVSCLTFSYDDKILAYGDVGGTIKVWKVKNGKCLRTIDVQLSESKAGVTNIKISPTCSKLYASCFDGAVKMFGLKSGSLL